MEGDISVDAGGGLSKATDKEVEAAAREEEEEEEEDDEEEVKEEGGSPWSSVPLEVGEEEAAPSPCTPKRGQRSGPS